MDKVKKRKPVPVRLVPLYVEEGGRKSEPYVLLEKIRNQFHQHLSECRIALAWHRGWTPDADGKLVLGKCKKASDLERELQTQQQFDAVILLNKDVWDDPAFTVDRKAALVDHELCHLEIARNAEGEAKYDERGRIVYRIRKHDIEEFRCIVARHGCYKADLEAFAQAILQRRQPSLFRAEPLPREREPEAEEATVAFAGTDAEMLRESSRRMRNA